MKIIYKYVFCLLVYVIPFASTVTPLMFRESEESKTFRTKMIKLANNGKEIFKNHPMEVDEWNKASFDEVLKEVVPFVCYVGDFVGDGKRITTVNDNYIKYCINVKNKISETMMKIANGKAKGGHIAVARVILEDNKVIPLPYFFLSGKTVGSTMDTLDLYFKLKESKLKETEVKKIKLKEEYFFNILLGDMSCDGAAAGFPHSERAIGLYLQNKMSGFLSKIKLIQIKNSAPMCHDCVLFWQNKAYNVMVVRVKLNAYEKNNLPPPVREFCAQENGLVYNVWDGYNIDSTLHCSNCEGDKVSITLEDLKCFTKKNHEVGPFWPLPRIIIIDQEIDGVKKRKIFKEEEVHDE